MILDEYKTSLQAVVKTKGSWDRDSGEYAEGTQTIDNFKGAVLPLSHDDYVKNPSGGYTRHDRKVYTSKKLMDQQTVLWNGYTWNINTGMDYDYIDPDFDRYYMRRVGVISD